MGKVLSEATEAVERHALLQPSQREGRRVSELARQLGELTLKRGPEDENGWAGR